MATKNTSSALRHRVTLQSPVLTPDTLGGYARTWSDVADLWAQIVPLNQRLLSTEKFGDARLQAITTHRITLRYRGSITADMRIIYGSRVFNILGITNPDEHNVTLQILAQEGAGG